MVSRMADIPLNIDTPSGTEFTVNKAIRVDSAGRVHVSVSLNSPKVMTEKDTALIKSVNATHDAVLHLPIKDARLLAYEILAKTEPTDGKTP